MKLNVLGVPSSAGAYCVGVELAPAALRAAGLLDALADAGNDVHDAGDLTKRQWMPDPGNRFAQNLDQEIEAMKELADAASALLADDARLLVLGGSCTVALGMCAAVAQSGDRPRMVYIDRHFDLNTPLTTTDGSLSWMGMAHALALDGAVDELTNASGRAPLLDPADLVYLGVDDTRATDWERSQARVLGITVVSQTELAEHPRHAAREARAALAPRPFMVHLDVDVLDFLDAPIAENVDGRNSGPSLTQLQSALAELWRDSGCRSLSIGQLDPAHARADPTALPRFVEALTWAASRTSHDED